MAEGKKTGGRKKGTPNKSTVRARSAVARFVDNNVHNMEKWIDEVAAENPEKAFKMLMDLMEYHIPKLQRTEHVGEDGGDINHKLKVEIIGKPSDS